MEYFTFLKVALGPGKSTRDLEILRLLSSPIQLIRGGQAVSLNDINCRVLISALSECDKHIDVYTFPGQLHSFAFYDNEEHTKEPAVSLQAFELMERFIRTHLKSTPTPLTPDLLEWR